MCPQLVISTRFFISAGIVEPVRSGVDEGTRLGLGKQEEDNVYTNSENVVRKRLETEIQADEDEERKERREVMFTKDRILTA